MNDGECLDTCPDAKYPKDGKCEECDASCKTCINGEECTGCEDPK